jgi:mRNA capping enzyme, guanylyltransferase (alpha) subunit
MSITEKSIRFKSEELTEFLSSLTGKEEVEFRFGSVITEGYKTKFEPGIPKYVFDQFVSHLSSSHSTEQFEDTVYFHENNIRQIVQKKPAELTSYQRKIRLQDVQIMASRTTSRLSSSREDILPDEEIKLVSDKVLFQRQRSRTRFDLDSFYIDCTTVFGGERISFEVEIELKFQPRNTTELFAPYVYTFNLLSQIDMETSSMVKDFNSLFPSKQPPRERFKIVSYDNHPRNIKENDLKTIKKYSVTNKLNGVGYYLFVAHSGVYLINHTDCIKVSHESFAPFLFSVLQGEWFIAPNGERQFHTFDCLRFQGKDVTNHPHLVRVKFIDMLLNSTPTAEGMSSILKRHNVVLARKRFFYSGKINTDHSITENDLEIDTQKCLEWMRETYGDDMELSNDGLVYTSADSSYMAKPILKYKFPRTMTIDFMIRDGKFIDNIYTFKLYVYNDRNINVLFPFNQPTISVEQSNPLFGSLSNGMIVECSFQDNKFIPERIRKDKIKPNFITVAQDVFYDMVHPMSPELLLHKLHEYKVGGEAPKLRLKSHLHTLGASHTLGSSYTLGSCLKEMRSYHNMEKRRLINLYYQHKNGLSIGFGRGGDIFKYNDAKAQIVFGIEPNIDNLNEANKRIGESQFTTQFDLIHEPAQNSLVISERIQEKIHQKVDVVDSFFSLTFFFESEAELDKLCNTIAGNLSQKGYFIGTTMDGQRTFDYLRGKDKVIVPECFSIEKQYQDGVTPDGGNKFGRKILIDLQETIVQKQWEYLVDFETLKQKLQKWGLVLVETGFFSPSSTVDPRVRPFSSLNRWFVFQRQETEKELATKERKETETQKVKDARKYVLRMLKPDTIQKFENKYGEPAQLVRIGTLGGGDCFFHSVLSLMDTHYNQLNEDEKKDYVKMTRRVVSEKLSEDIWRRLGNGQLAIMLVVNSLVELFDCDVSLKKYITKMETIHAHDLMEWSEKFLSMVDDDLKTKMNRILLAVSNIVYQTFKKNIFKCGVWVSYDMIEFLSSVFHVNIYIIRDSTRAPYPEATTKCNREQKSVILLWVGESHYEAMGIHDSGQITRVFPPNDPIIERINKILKC